MLRLSTGLRNKIAGIDVNKILNGSFTTDTSSWTAIASVLASIAGGQSGNCLRITTNSASPAKAYQDITCKIGHYYMLIVYGKNGTCSTGKVMIGTVADEDAVFDSGDNNFADWTVFPASIAGVIVFQATATTHRITLQNSDTSNTGKTYLFDEVKLISLARAIRDIFYKGFINIYVGSQPGTPDNAPGSTLLCTIYSDGSSAGLSFEEAVAGTITKKSTETWSGTAVATGTAGWWRLITPGDDGSGNTTDERLDGAIATTGAELNMASLTIVINAIQSISTFQATVSMQA